jgi:hypothetical protein
MLVVGSDMFGVNPDVEPGCFERVFDQLCRVTGVFLAITVENDSAALPRIGLVEIRTHLAFPRASV